MAVEVKECRTLAEFIAECKDAGIHLAKLTEYAFVEPDDLGEGAIGMVGKKRLVVTAFLKDTVQLLRWQQTRNATSNVTIDAGTGRGVIRRWVRAGGKPDQRAAGNRGDTGCERRVVHRRIGKYFGLLRVNLRAWQRARFGTERHRRGKPRLPEQPGRVPLGRRSVHRRLRSRPPCEQPGLDFNSSRFSSNSSDSSPGFRVYKQAPLGMTVLAGRRYNQNKQPLRIQLLRRRLVRGSR